MKLLEIKDTQTLLTYTCVKVTWPKHEQKQQIDQLK